MIALGFSLGANVLEAVAQTDPLGWLCLLALLVLSVVSSYYAIAKWSQLRYAGSQSEEFIEECMEGRKSLQEIYKSAEEYPESPLAALLREAYLEYNMEIQGSHLAALSLQERVALGKTSVESALERTMSSELRKLEDKLIWIATASSLSPFIGLFGTVWGVLGAFQALGRDGGAALTTLAPGVSTALITTVFGLVVAIPAAFFYNVLSNRVLKLNSQMDSFSHELSNVFQKHLLKRGGEG